MLKDLDGHVTAKTGIPRQVDLPHATRAEQRLDHVLAVSRAGLKNHVPRFRKLSIAGDAEIRMVAGNPSHKRRRV